MGKHLKSNANNQRFKYNKRELKRILVYYKKGLYILVS
jgi:hypothetical protein